MPDQELTWRMHFMFGTLSYTMAGNDALRLIATCNLEGGDDAEAIMAPADSLPCRGIAGRRYPRCKPNAACRVEGQHEAQPRIGWRRNTMNAVLWVAAAAAVLWILAYCRAGAAVVGHQRRHLLGALSLWSGAGAATKAVLWTIFLIVAALLMVPQPAPRP